MYVLKRVRDLLGIPAVAATPMTGGDICRAWSVRLDDGSEVFVKEAPPNSLGLFAAESAGLEWLAVGGARVPRILATTADLLILELLTPTEPTPRAAFEFGLMLAELHEHKVDYYGQAPGSTDQGWIGSAPMSYGQYRNWPTFYANERIRPYLTRAPLLEPDVVALLELCQRIDEVAVPPMAPARLHGDLWAGNIMFSTAGPALIDPAAYGGHPETDLGMLLLFPPPYLQEILAGYQEIAVLRPDWQSQVALHQIYPLLVHAVIFDSGHYGAAAARRARELLAAAS